MGIDVDVEAAAITRLEIAMGQQAATMARIERRMAAQTPAYVPFYGSAKSDGAGSNLLITCRPQVQHGYIWHVRYCLFSGVSTLTSVGGTGLVFSATSEPGSVSAGDRPDAFQDTATLPFPQPAFYGHGEFTVKAPGLLYAIVLTPDVSTSYFFGGFAEMVPDLAFAGATTEL